PIKTTLIKIIGKFGAKAKPNIPIILLDKPIGSAYGIGFLSVYNPITGCITEATMFKVNAMSPSCVNVSPSDSSNIGNIAGMTACNESFNKWASPIMNKMEYCVLFFVVIFVIPHVHLD